MLTEPASVTGAFREEIQFVLVEQICAVSRVVGLGMENHNPPYFPQSHIEIQSPTKFFTHYTCVFKYSNVMASKCATLIYMCPVDQTQHKYMYHFRLFRTHYLGKWGFPFTKKIPQSCIWPFFLHLTVPVLIFEKSC